MPSVSRGDNRIGYSYEKLFKKKGKWRTVEIGTNVVKRVKTGMKSSRNEFFVRKYTFR